MKGDDTMLWLIVAALVVYVLSRRKGDSTVPIRREQRVAPAMEPLEPPPGRPALALKSRSERAPLIGNTGNQLQLDANFGVLSPI